MAKHEQQAYERLGAKVLTLPDVIAQSVGFMGPVFSSAFVIPLVVGVISASGKGGGVASPLSVLIAAVGVFAIGAIVSRYAKEVHAAGSLYDYVTRGLGERTGTAAGWLYYAGVTVLMTGLLLLIGGYLESTIQAEFKVDPLPAWAWTLLVIALIAVVLYFGVRVSVRSQLVLALVSIIVVTIFFIVVIVKLGSANSLKPFNPSSAADGWSGIIFGVLYGVLLFVGFETAANLAEETPKPDKHIPAAVMITAGIATVFFILAAYVEVAGFRYSLKTLTARPGRRCSRWARRPRRAGTAAPGSTGCSSSWSSSTCWRSRSAAPCPPPAASSPWRGTAGSPVCWPPCRDGTIRRWVRRCSWSARRWSRWPSTSGGPACSRCRIPRTTSRCSPGGPPSAGSRWWWCTC